MNLINEFTEIISEIRDLESRFVDSRTLGLFLPTEHAAKLKGLVTESISLLSTVLGPRNAFSSNIVHAINSGIDGPSLAGVQAIVSVLEGAVRHLSRIEVLEQERSNKPSKKEEYIAITRIVELESLKSDKYDLARLAQICKELNQAYNDDSYMTVAILVRAIVDHVPPIFSQDAFQKIANNYAGTRSFKASMRHLDESLRNIADAHLHTQIRAKESLPQEQQINFKAELDVLLAEVIRLLK